MVNERLELLVDALAEFPSVSAKSAKKIALFLLRQDLKKIDNLVSKIYDVKKKIGFCNECNSLIDKTIENLCQICSNPYRDHQKICVVSSLIDAEKIENAKVFNGVYYVINGELSTKFSKPKKHLNLERLIERVKPQSKEKIKEIIVATNPTLDGQFTAQAVAKSLLAENKNLQIFRLGYGLPYNSQINYIDEISLEQSLTYKQEIKIENFKKNDE